MLGPVKRLSWWQVLVLIACLFGIFVACLALWLRSDGDLAAVDARARSLGLPSGPADLVFADAAPDRVADWRRLLALGGSLAPWSDTEPGRTWVAQPGAVVPDTLRAHHAALPAAELAELDALLARLGDAPIDSDRNLAPGAQRLDVTALRRLMRLLCERIALAAPDRLPAELAAAAALVPLREPPGLLRLMVAATLAEQWAAAAMLRAADLGAARPQAAELATRLAAIPVAALAPAWRNDLAALRGFAADADPDQVWRNLGRGGGTFSLDAWGFAIALRSGRARTIELMQDVAAAAGGDPLDLSRQLTAARLATQEAARPSWFRPGSLLPAMTLPVAEPVVAAVHAARLRLLLIAAELGGKPWPPDLFAADRAPLRRIERDGRLVGAYTVGPDGHDDGGTVPLDRRWPLYATLDP